MSETLLGGTVSSRVRRFSRVPMAVYQDPKLNFIDHTAYGLVSATVYEGDVASVGVRLIAQLLRVSRATAARSLRRLIEAGHLEALQRGEGSRAKYRLTSPVFAATVAKDATVGTARVTLNRCGRCSKMRKVDISGYCRACKFEAEIDRRAAKLA